METRQKLKKKLNSLQKEQEKVHLCLILLFYFIHILVDFLFFYAARNNC